MSEKEIVDLSAPEYQTELTPEQIAALGEKKKYVDGAYYPLEIVKLSTPPIGFSPAKLDNGELNAEANGNWFLGFDLAPVQISGAKSHKLDEVKYQKQYFFDKMGVAAMKRVGYTTEQIQKVAAMTMPNTYDGFCQFARAFFPEKFSGDFPRWNRDAKTFLYKGVSITEEQYKAWENEQKKVYVQIQNDVRANPKQLLGKKAFWMVQYQLEDKKDPTKGKKRWPSAAFPYSFGNPPKDKDGVLKPILDPEKDFQ